MIHEPIARAAESDVEVPSSPLFPAGTGLEAADLGISVQARALGDLDAVLDALVRRDPLRRGSLLDLGCGMGALANHIGGRLGMTELIGVDLDPERLKAAAARGVRPLLIDLNDEPLPVRDGSVRAVTCFGLLAYLSLYDNTISEASRVLEDGGWLLLSMPNLGSYSNRLALLLGRQPHAVAVSRFRQAGTFGRRRDVDISANMPPLLHGATLRCMKELLGNFGFDVEVVRGFAPGPRRRRLTDGVMSRFPSLSRRFLILARKRPTA